MTKRTFGRPDRPPRNALTQWLSKLWIPWLQGGLLLIIIGVWVAAMIVTAIPSLFIWLASCLTMVILLGSFVLMVRQSKAANTLSYHKPMVEALLRSEAVPLAIIDPQGVIMELNEGAERTFGYERAELMGNWLASFVDAGSRDALHTMLEHSLTGCPKQGNIHIIHRSGYPLELHLVCAPMVQDEKVIGTMVVSHDLSDRKRNVERIRYMAYYDDRTGLPNRTLFQMRLNESLAYAHDHNQLVGLCYMDLDRFKLVNASFGREFGDMLLMQVAERFTSVMSEQDFAARMEGDEFALLFKDLESEEQLLSRARMVLQAIEEPYELKGFPIQITASIGAVTSRLGEDDDYALLNKADMALMKVKQNGRNDALLYSESWSNYSFEHLSMQHEMYRAIQRKEFILYYQPQYDMISGGMIGVEALVRWKHPIRGMIPPGDFIPLAEESGMIVQIGDWVLEEACRQNKCWQESGLPPMPVSVNLSIRQFVQHDLASKVADVLTRTGLDSQYLDLEITESMTMDVNHVSRCLLDLTALGVGISIDDFGTGYSSFHYLKNFPIDRLKIDRSFVRDIQQDPSDAEIVAAIIAMAHNLNIQVIAEGVETQEQIEFLRKHNCDEMQGYFWSAPVPSDNIEQMLGGYYM
ncbi:putative bifunctional diguanylate cyclase/phosphodiesterase [Paenibacillus sp. Leaf72]|uniref:putative bifunctional diguanylate cyclase/phosphodiesterase n=1 Tax=Paenibacillus sp. Leaf72 TaxID=1736234 RepID=UPI0006FA00FF|nr:bifunctional diguanylate cyclase/phosphodiesterase [Paenibacillus sp. Leaf72]KQO01249.1 diguanylate cyclase [Paenibacillus sp. Leaf72]